uniref:Ricin B-type lectin domain-containing protein n=1 Tax=Elaeophora elaphi TaxID=1147741 RepID=A0A0R3S122_9BILA
NAINNKSQLLYKLTLQYSCNCNKRRNKELQVNCSRINFVPDCFCNNVAYVQLKLVNSSKGQIAWKLKTNNKCITALPNGRGLVPARKTDTCLLSWQLPTSCQSWDKVENAKLLIVAKNIAKYIGKCNFKLAQIFRI